MADEERARFLEGFALLYRAAMDAGDADWVALCLGASYASDDPALDEVVDRINRAMYEEEFGTPEPEPWEGPRLVVRWERGVRIFWVHDGGRGGP